MEEASVPISKLEQRRASLTPTYMSRGSDIAQVLGHELPWTEIVACYLEFVQGSHAAVVTWFSKLLGSLRTVLTESQLRGEAIDLPRLPFTLAGLHVPCGGTPCQNVWQPRRTKSAC